MNLSDSELTESQRPFFVAAIGKIVTAVGVVVLAGWVFELEPLKRLSPNFVAMNPVTAICFVLIGIAFECLRKPTASKVRRICGSMIAILVALVAGAKLAAYLLGLPLRLDAMLFGLALEEVASRIPNQMAPNTAFNFVLLGVALCFLNARRRQFPIYNMFALGTAATALLTIVGYAYGVTQFTRVSVVFIPMALHTALTFLCLQRGSSSRDRTRHWRKSLPLAGRHA